VARPRATTASPAITNRRTTASLARATVPATAVRAAEILALMRAQRPGFGGVGGTAAGGAAGGGGGGGAGAGEAKAVACSLENPESCEACQ